jgi:cytochrome c-type biogenesis protein CcmH
LTPFWTIALFWIFAAAGVAIALAFLLPPLLRGKNAGATASRRDINIAVYRDQLKEMATDQSNGLLTEAQFQTAKLELEARLAEDALAQADASAAPVRSRKLGYALAIVLPISAFGLYFLSGNPAALMPVDAASGQANAMAGKHDIQKMLQQLEAKVVADPKDGQSWAILGKTYAAQGRWPEAWKAYQLAADQLPDEASLLSGQAEALAVLMKGALKGEPMRLVNRALAIDPSDKKGLELAAAHAFQEKDPAQAVIYLERLSQVLPSDDPFTKEVRAALAAARQQTQTAGLDNLSAPPAQAAPSPSASATIRGSLDLAPALRTKLSGQEEIFLFARPLKGGPPVAAVRGPAARFPMDFELSDRWAMNPGNPLSRHDQVTLVARISRSGGPMAQPGDLEGSIGKVAVGAQGVQLVIDKVIP